MRKYFYLSLLLLIAAIQAWACGPTERPNYYMFSAFNREQMGSTFDYRINEYWKNYVGKGFNDWDVSSLSYFDIDNMQNSQNSIVKTALAHNDIETIKYLKHLVTYLRICGNISEDRWDVTVIACGSSAPAFKSPEIPFRHMTAASSHDWGSCSTYPGWGKSEWYSK